MEISRCCPRASTREPHVSIWTSSIFFGHLIYNRRACSGLDLYAGQHICTVKLIQGILIVTSILQPLAGASSSSSSIVSSDHDSANEYLKIGGSTCGDSVEEGRLIVMVALAGEPSHNSSNRYPTIGRSEASDARMPNDGMI
jgi:hypothetical protein